MKNKLLALKVSDAKLFQPARMDRHAMLISSSGDAVKRVESPGSWVSCPPDTFLASSVSGALHVLAGERPVPTIRRNTLLGSPQRVLEIDELAKNSFVEVTSGVVKDDKTGEMQMVPKFGEVLMTRKSSTDSTDPAAYPLSIVSPKGRALVLLSWDRCYAHLGPEKFDKLCSHMAEVLGTDVQGVKKLSFIQALGGTYKAQSKLTVDFLEKESIKDPWKKLLLDGEATDAKALRQGYDTMFRESYALAVPRGKEMVSTRDAIIYVPVDDSDLERFQNGNGWSTILDGGLVSIIGVLDFFPAMLTSAKQTYNPEGMSCI